MNVPKKVAIAVVGVLLQVNSAFAAQWVNILRHPVQGMMVAIDVSSVRNLGIGSIELWSRHTYSPPETVVEGPQKGRSYSSELNFLRIDCIKRRQVLLWVLLRDENMHTVLSDSLANPVWEPIPPESVRDAVRGAACSRDYPKA